MCHAIKICWSREVEATAYDRVVPGSMRGCNTGTGAFPDAGHIRRRHCSTGRRSDSARLRVLGALFRDPCFRTGSLVSASSDFNLGSPIFANLTPVCSRRLSAGMQCSAGIGQPRSSAGQLVTASARFWILLGSLPPPLAVRLAFPLSDGRLLLPPPLVPQLVVAAVAQLKRILAARKEFS